MLIDFKDEDFDSKIKNEDVSVIQFSASWCGPCKALTPIVSEISDEMTDIDFGSMNIDNHPNTPTQYGVRGIPTCILVVGGELKSTKVGMTKKTDFLSWLKENI